MGLPLSRELACADAVVMGVPYDLGTSGRAGARSGPNAIRQASAHLRWETRRWPWPFHLADYLRVIDYGDVQFAAGDSAHMLSEVESHASQIVSAGKTLVSLGGDHFVTLALLRGHVATHGRMALIHFDAHTDTEQAHETFDHGSMFCRAPQEGLVDTAHSIQVGVRTDYERTDHAYQVIDADEASGRSVEDIVNAIRARVGDALAYLTFDIDCLDPAFAPGTGTPVVGGLSTSRALRILRGIAELNIVGFDLVEVSPPFDQAQVTSLAGATLALEFLYMRACRDRRYRGVDA
ncbi:MAG: agmatinase [Halioglobus sp.]|nr:agmatinase [Halioglobus sp.]